MTAGEGVEKKGLSYTVGGDVNWYRHYRKQYGGTSENWKETCHVIPQSHSWAYIWTKL